MRLAAAILIVAACGGSELARPARPAPPASVAATPFPPVPPDAAPADAWPEVAPEPPAVQGPAVGAMPVPGEIGDDLYAQPPVEELDTTITAADLPAARGTWRKRARVAKGGGEVLLALHVADKQLELAVVEDQTGIHEQFTLLGTDAEVHNHTFDGTAYPSPVRGDINDGYKGPIVFAIRIVPHGKTVAHQLVVFFERASLFVAERPLGTTRWTRRLRLDFKPNTTFLGIGTTDPH